MTGRPAMHKPEAATVATIAEAKIGDWLWVYDREKPMYDSDRKYIGRGGYTLQQVSEENKVSLIIDRLKFDRKTGKQRATGQYSPNYHAFGETERADNEWLKANRHRIERALMGCNSAAVYRAIDALLKEGK